MYDPSMIVGNGRGFTGNEDYTHYPYPDEYLNERNRQYLGTNGDPYAAVNKPQRPTECKYYILFFHEIFFGLYMEGKYISIFYRKKSENKNSLILILFLLSMKS